MTKLKRLNITIMSSYTFPVFVLPDIFTQSLQHESWFYRPAVSLFMGLSCLNSGVWILFWFPLAAVLQRTTNTFARIAITPGKLILSMASPNHRVVDSVCTGGSAVHVSKPCHFCPRDVCSRYNKYRVENILSLTFLRKSFLSCPWLCHLVLPNSKK